MSEPKQVLIVIGVLLASYLVFKMIYDTKIGDLKKGHAEELKKIGEKAVAASKTTLRGKISEELAPIFKGFPYNLSDAKFLGSPFDYLVLENMSDLRDGDKEKEIGIVFADVKTGNAVLSPIQKKIKEAVLAGRFRFETWTIKDNELKIK